MTQIENPIITKILNFVMLLDGIKETEHRDLLKFRLETYVSERDRSIILRRLTEEFFAFFYPMNGRFEGVAFSEN